MNKLIEKIAMIALGAMALLVLCFILILCYNHACIFTDAVVTIAQLSAVIATVGGLVTGIYVCALLEL